MKKLFVIAAALLAMVGCKSKQNEPVQMVPVKFYVGIPSLTIENGPAKAPADDQYLPDHLYIFEGKKLHDVLTSFDKVVLELDPGQHQLNFVASKGTSTFDENTGILTPSSIEYSFGKVVSINVSEDAENESAVDLSRVYYNLTVRSTDNVPSDGTYTVRFRISKKYTGFTDGLAGANEMTDVVLGTVTATAGNVFQQKLVGINPVYNQEATNILETIVYKNGNLLNKFVTHNVPLLCNRRTLVTGEMFKPSGLQLKINETWINDETISILDSEN